ncbi:MAG: HDIG domain-containing protein [Methanomassiliicoccaceae archaeon]|nr:HDIG domain-containing protein [Methanomassiliicoccaceae archaeon]
MSKYPNEAQCIAFLERAGCSKRVIIHCCTVKAVAETFAKGFSADTELIIAGALLHDLGRSKDHTIMHANTGADMAARLGLPKELVDIIRKHIGAGLDDTDAEELGLPKRDYIPRTLEEKIVAHADNMVSDNRVVGHSHTADKLRAKGSQRGAERVAMLHRELSAAYGKDLDGVASSLGESPALSGLCAALVRK